MIHTCKSFSFYFTLVVAINLVTGFAKYVHFWVICIAKCEHVHLALGVGCTAWEDGAGFRSIYAMRSSITKRLKSKKCCTACKSWLFTL